MVGWTMLVGCGWFGYSLPVDAYIEGITVRSNDARRRAFLHVPPGNPLASRPLWIVLHGSTYDDPAKGRAAAARWIDALNDEAIYAFPDAAGTDAERPWHGPWGSYQYRDLVFLRDLIAAIHADHSVDLDRIYLVGHGEGVSLVSWAQCADPKRYAGFAFVDGGVPDVVREACRPTIRRPVLALHQEPSRLEEPWAPWLLATHECTPQPVDSPIVEGPSTSRGQGRRYDCWTVPSVELWALRPSTDCVPRDPPPCDWVGPKVIGDYFEGFATVEAP